LRHLLADGVAHVQALVLAEEDAGDHAHGHAVPAVAIEPLQ
jgi:hypothetical protein